MKVPSVQSILYSMNDVGTLGQTDFWSLIIMFQEFFMIFQVLPDVIVVDCLDIFCRFSHIQKKRKIYFTVLPK